MACRQELVEAAGDNITELRAAGGNQGYNTYGRYVDHLISAIAVRKHHVSVKLSDLRGRVGNLLPFLIYTNIPYLFFSSTGANADKERSYQVSTRGTGATTKM